MSKDKILGYVKKCNTLKGIILLNAPRNLINRENSFMKDIFLFSSVYVWQGIYFRSEGFHVV